MPQLGGPWHHFPVATSNDDKHPFIRNYQSTDWDAVYDVCIRTGDTGGDAYLTFAEPQVVAEIFAGPYLYLEPELAFVLDDGERPVGYVIGTADTADFVKAYSEDWLPRLRRRWPGPPAQPFATRDEFFLYLMHSPERMLVPEVLDGYPGHLHIDILPSYQSRGFGRRLINTFMEAAGLAGAEGVHVGVGQANQPAHGFYRNVGFHKLDVPSASEEVTYYGRKTATG